MLLHRSWKLVALVVCVLVVGICGTGYAAVTWEKFYVAEGVKTAISAIENTSDGGYLVSGNTDTFFSGPALDRDTWLMKLDALGDIQWQKTYGSSVGTGDFATILSKTSDGGFVVAGKGGWFLKLDVAGEIQWQKPLLSHSLIR
jgi:hypothetical protein